MDLLLDTNAFIFASWQPERLSAAAREAILGAGNRMYLSTVVVWECATKASVGKFTFDPDVESWVTRQIRALGLTILPVGLVHCYRYLELPFQPQHRDPFDRMLIAQGLAERVPIVSSDSRFRRYEVDVIW